MEKTKLGGRFWGMIAVLGFVGQLAWCIENNYINLWVFSQTGSTDAITWMTVVSALMATATTFVIGTLSDRIGKRKAFISAGYIIWGVTVFLFGLISKDNMTSLYGEEKAILMVGVWMVIIDSLMTFFGSSANDACFNAMVTDLTDSTNRGKVESFLSILPLVATVAMMAIGMPLHVAAQADDYLKGLVENGTYASEASALANGWFWYFVICGAVVAVCGIISIFLIPKDKCIPNRDESYWKNLIYGFRPSVIKKNVLLYIALLIFFCFNSAINSFMPYYMVYMNLDAAYGGLGLIGMDFYISVGIIFVLSSVLVILYGVFILDRFDRVKQLFISLGITAVGMTGLIFVKSVIPFTILATFLILGYLMSTAIIGALVRDLTPKKEAGLFQGVRMVFAVLLPMVTGPLISSSLFTVTEYNDPTNVGLNGKTPNSLMFLVGLCFLVLSIAPTVWLLLENRKAKKAKEAEEA